MGACEEFEERISAFIDGQLPPEEREALMEHMADCLDCQAYFDDQIAIQDALDRAGVQAPELTADNYAQVLEGVIASAGGSPAGQQAAALKASLDSYDGFCQGLRQYTAGVEIGRAHV